MKNSILAALFVTLFPVSVFAAGSVTTGVLAQININNGSGGASFTMPALGASGTRPGCTSSSVYVYAFDATTITGQTTIKMLEASKLANQTITVYGTGDCSYANGFESVAGIAFQ